MHALKQFTKNWIYSGDCLQASDRARCLLEASQPHDGFSLLDNWKKTAALLFKSSKQQASCLDHVDDCLCGIMSIDTPPSTKGYNLRAASHSLHHNVYSPYAPMPSSEFAFYAKSVTLRNAYTQHNNWPSIIISNA